MPTPSSSTRPVSRFSYPFAWSTNGSPDLADTDEIVTVSSLIKGKKAICTVTAYNPAGSTTVSSPPFLVHDRP